MNEAANWQLGVVGSATPSIRRSNPWLVNLSKPLSLAVEVARGISSDLSPPNPDFLAENDSLRSANLPNHSGEDNLLNDPNLPNILATHNLLRAPESPHPLAEKKNLRTPIPHSLLALNASQMSPDPPKLLVENTSLRPLLS